MPDVNSELNISDSVCLSEEANHIKLKNWVSSTADTVSSLFIHEPEVETIFSSNTSDFDRRGDIIVFAHRRRAKQENNISKDPQQDPDEKATVSERSDDISKADTERSDCSSEVSDESSDESELDSSSSASVEDISAEETCSEGSTELDSDDTSEFEMEELANTSKKFNSTSSEEEDDSDFGGDTSDYNSDDSRLDATQTHQSLIDTKFDLEDMETSKNKRRPAYDDAAKPGRSKKDRKSATIIVFDTRSAKPLRKFHYEQDISVMLYHSGPVLHPFKPLVVWPLAGGEILFADYDENTYFIRGSFPSTRDSECTHSKRCVQH
jgi:hypothetical protein